MTLQKVSFSLIALLLILSITGCKSDKKIIDESTNSIESKQKKEITPLLPKKKLTAGFLAIDGVYNSELFAPYDILQHSIFHTKPGIETFIVSPTMEKIMTFEG
ncbi:MAG: hypothetical protein ACI85I_001581, partial [Arenicella sp.]